MSNGAAEQSTRKRQNCLPPGAPGAKSAAHSQLAKTDGALWLHNTPHHHANWGKIKDYKALRGISVKEKRGNRKRVKQKKEKKRKEKAGEYWRGRCNNQVTKGKVIGTYIANTFLGTYLY